MARRRKKRRGSKSKAIPVLPVVASVLPAYSAYQAAGGLTAQLPKQLVQKYTGIADGTFYPEAALKAWGPILIGIVGHKIAAKTVNRYIKKATMGYLVL